MDAQDAQDNQDGTLLHEKPAPAMIVCGFADAQITSLPFPEKILCILCIHVDQNLFRASIKPLAAEFCKRFWCSFVSIRGSSFPFVDIFVKGLHGELILAEAIIL